MRTTTNNYLFVRHGQTYWNKNGIMHGQYDIPLNEIGISQAKKLSDRLKRDSFDVCYCSPLQRARTTALQILKNHKQTQIIYDNRLKELSKGLLEGKHLNSEKMLANEDPSILNKYQIESKREFFNRVASLINEIEQRHSGKRILVVAHSGTIKMCYFAFNYPTMPIHKAYYQLRIKNCEPYTLKNIEFKEKQMKIGFFPMVADILHAGHVLALEQAKKQCDYLIVGLHCNPDYKQPQQTIYERYMQLRAVKWVDEIIPYQNITCDADIISSLDYDVYFLGADHKDKQWELKESIQENGKEIIYIDRNHSYSSSKIKSQANAKK